MVVREPSRRELLRWGGVALAGAAAGGLSACARPSADPVATAAVGPLSIEAAIAPLAGSNIQIIDTGHGTNEAFLRPLAGNGVKTIFRYYAQENNLPGKNVTVRERDMIFDHGLSLAIVYQHKAYLPSRFTAATGEIDARFCLTRAAEIRQPEGSAIFFGVDSDAHRREDVLAYLEAAKRVIGGRYAIGCYGSGAHCEAGVEHGHAAMSWVAEAPAWGGTRDFINSGRWHLYQNKTQIEDSRIMSAGGIPIDTNVLNPRFDTIGAFDRAGAIVRYDAAQVRLAYDRRRFVAASQLNVRDRPGGEIIAHVCLARTVHVLGVDDGWARIDIDEDGRADGYCSAEFLRPLNAMPDYARGCAPLAI